MELLKFLSEAHGVSGDEFSIAEEIANIVKPHCSEMFIDNMGNLFCFKKGTGEDKKTIMLCAHTDEVGIIISSVTEDGFLKFRTDSFACTSNSCCLILSISVCSLFAFALLTVVTFALHKSTRSHMSSPASNSNLL